jgi:hypothetical protein
MDFRIFAFLIPVGIIGTIIVVVRKKARGRRGTGELLPPLSGPSVTDVFGNGNSKAEDYASEKGPQQQFDQRETVTTKRPRIRFGETCSVVSGVIFGVMVIWYGWSISPCRLFVNPTIFPRMTFPVYVAAALSGIIVCYLCWTPVFVFVDHMRKTRETELAERAWGLIRVASSVLCILTMPWFVAVLIDMWEEGWYGH